MVTKREHWLDFIKIIASFLVIILHTVCYGINNKISSPALLVYYIGTFAIPLFWMASGYIQLRKKVTYQYAFKKILKILFIAFVWNTLFILFGFLIKGKFENPMDATVKSFIQMGDFFQFWFLGSLILIYLFLPLLSRIFNNSRNTYKVFVFILLVICVLINIYNIYNYSIGEKIIKERIAQTFRMWTWLLYFCIGGYLSKNNILEKLSTTKHCICVLFFVILTICYEYFYALKLYGSLYAENFYDSIFVIFTSIMIFTCLKKVKWKKIEAIADLETLVMGVYIIHTSIINLIGIFHLLNNNWVNMFVAIIVFLISLFISYMISIIPKVNLLIKI